MNICTILSWCICILVSSIKSKMLLLYLKLASLNFRCDVKGRIDPAYSIGLEYITHSGMLPCDILTIKEVIHI